MMSTTTTTTARTTPNTNPIAIANNTTTTMEENNNINNNNNYSTVLELNSLGVANLMNGNLAEAFRLLCKAFEIAKHEQTTARREEEEKESSSSPSSYHDGIDETLNAPLQATSTTVRTWPLLSREQVIPTLSLTQTSDLRTDGLMITTGALKKCKHDDDDNDDGSSSRRRIGRQEWTLVSAFVVYNIGIIYSIGAMQGSNEAHHNKARMMFESSLGLIRCALFRPAQGEPTRRLSPTGNPLVDVLSLMILAKASQAYHFLSRFDGACAYAHQLGDFIRLLRQDVQYSDDIVINQLVEAHCERVSFELSSLLKLQAFAPAA